MSDREKVIKGLREISEYTRAKADIAGVGKGKELFDSWYRAAEDALELLKEQKPIKPTVAVDTWICSKCGHRLESQDLIDDKENPQVLVHELYQYCPNCGRAVKWENE